MDNFEYENKKRKRLKRGPIYIILCIICLILGTAGGYIYRDRKQVNVLNKEADIYQQVSSLVEDEFLDTTESKETLQERMIYGMIAALGDRHSAFLSRQQANDLSTSINGAFQGIGVTFLNVECGAIILDVYQDTPAKKAGLMNGDVITHIQGTSIAGYTSDKIKDCIKGKSGTDVTLKILRNGKSQDVHVTRGSVETSVNYEVRMNGNQKIGYLKLTTFGEGSHKLVEEALAYFQDQKVENLVLDLRGNGGGYLEAAKRILDLFIEEDKVLFRVQNKDGEEETYKATNCPKYIFEKGFILVDGNTASAAEVMSGTLKEYLDYKLVGEKTYGKGTVQTQYPLSDSSIIKLTRAKWLTPSKTCINGIGFEPDYEVKSKSIYDFYMGKFEGPYEYDQVDNNILNMQKMLKELGYQVDRTDGYYSKGTKSAMEAFESQYGITINGIYEKNDATLLLSALTYHIYQELDDQVYLKATEFMK